MSDLLNNAASGLLAFQRAISTTSHNIANARTEGYSRQRVELQSVPGERGVRNAPGNGTRVQDVARLHDEFAAARVLESTSAHAREETHHALAARIDSLIADEALGLGPAMSGLNAALEDAAADPGSDAARESVLAAADTLAGRFGTLQAQLDDTRGELEQRTRAELDSLNDLAAGVADLNRRIVSSRGGDDRGSNDLLDQRDLLIEKIAAHVEVTPLPQDNGALNLLVGGGVALVLGERAATLHLTSDPSASGGQRLELDTGDGRRQAVGSAPLGGRLGGLHDFAEETLDPVAHRIGRLALVTAETINAQHAAGLDANGEPGGEWFASAAPRATPGEANTGGATLEVEITDTAALAASDYLLRWDGAAFEVTRRGDGTRTTGGTTLAVDGLEIRASGAPAVGDTFLVSATGHAAGGIESTLARPGELALARTLVATSEPTNEGDATLRQPSVNDRDDPALRSAVDIVFTADDAYDVVDRASGTPLASGVAWTPGEAIAFNGWSTTLEGTPKGGDVLRIDPNTGGVGDNGNALALSALQDARSIGGAASAGDEHASLVSFVGGRTRSLATRAGALESLRDGAVERAESVSGVSLDEEAIELTRYEQAYQASAQAIAVADTLFQSILGAVRR